MTIDLGLVGRPERTRQWESYVRQIQGVSKVILAGHVKDVQETSGCLILTDDEPTARIEEAIRAGLHCYAVAPIPEDPTKAARLEKLASEAGVQLLFAHWPTYAPTTRTMNQEMASPERLVTIRTDSAQETLDQTTRSRRFWMDEIGWILKMAPSPVHSLEAETLFGATLPHPGLQVRFQFHNGATGIFLHHPMGDQASHRRWLFRKDRLLDCDVLTQRLSRTLQQSNGNPLMESEWMDPSQTAILSIEQFLRAIQRQESFHFSIHDVVTNLNVIERIRRLI
ncbi:MAG: hypothetical protein WD115_01720 [Balneolaceae bacterium]